MFADSRVAPHAQTIRLNAGAFTASQTKDITVTWPVPFADANYVLVTDIVESGGATANNDGKRQVLTQTAVDFSLRIAAGTVGYSDGQLLIHAIAIHD